MGLFLISLLLPALSCTLPGTNSPKSTSTQPYTEVYTPDGYVQPLYNPTQSPSYKALVIATTTPNAILSIVLEEDSDTSLEEDLNEHTTYTAEQGDSLYKIAFMFCGDSREYKYLLRINNMREGDILEVGQSVVVACERKP